MAACQWLCLLVTACMLLNAIYACNEAVCASLVSKCMLLKSCECNMMDKNNCTCCKDCHKCLAKLYTECCSCVGMCPASDPKDNLYKTSTVEELRDPIPGLFNVLTEEEDPYLRWTTYTYPTHLDLLYFKPRGDDSSQTLDLTKDGDGEGHTIRHGHHRITFDPSASAQNCTVAYMSQCMPLNKCRLSCQSMGAARYRWFHDHGCCECIATSCLDFGKGEPLCLKCPDPEEEDFEEDDYGEYEEEEEEFEEEEGDEVLVEYEDDEEEDLDVTEDTGTSQKDSLGGLPLEDKKILAGKNPNNLDPVDLHKDLNLKSGDKREEQQVAVMEEEEEEEDEEEEELEDDQDFEDEEFKEDDFDDEEDLESETVVEE